VLGIGKRFSKMIDNKSTEEEKLNKTFRLEHIYIRGGKLVFKTDCFIIENNILTFKNFNFYDVEEFTFNIDTLEIMRIIQSKLEEEDENDESYLSSTKVTTLVTEAIPNEKESKVICNITDIEEVKFINCNLNSLIIDKKSNLKKLTLDNSISRKKIEIKNKPLDKLNFNGSKFYGKVEIRNCIVEELSFEETTLKDISVFTETTFNQDVNFKYTTFEKLALFRKTVFKKKLNLEDSIIKEEANFLEITSIKDERKDIDVANRETARIIKHSFENQNNIIESNRFYALEMSEMDDKLLWTDNFFEKLVFKFHSISSNHSQSWFLALLWIFIVGMIVTILQLKEIKFEIDIIYGSMTFVFLLLLSIYYEKLFQSKIYYVSSLFIAIFYNFIFNKIPILELFKQINPFSKLSSNDMTEIDFIAKVIIAYLIYQFVISIRQNTRRK